MANIKTPDGGFYVDDTQFTVDYQTNIVSLKNGSGSGDYLTLDGGMMNPDAVISGEDSLEISLASGNKSAVIGLSAEGTTISNETSDSPTASIRVIENVIEVKANDTTVTMNGSGVNLGGASVSGVTSITGQDSGEVTIETVLDMNNHKITNVANPEAGNDVMNKTTADTTYATKTEIADFITNDDLPVLATTSVAGIVKQGVVVSDSSGATDTALEGTVNALLASLRAAGIIAST